MEAKTLDGPSLKALAPPLRMRLLAELRYHGPATATKLGEALGESSGATSYHLRVLAAHGFVVDDTAAYGGRGRGRRRPRGGGGRRLAGRLPGPGRGSPHRRVAGPAGQRRARVAGSRRPERLPHRDD